MDHTTVRPKSGLVITEYGAPSAILPEYLAERLGWRLDAHAVPDEVFKAAEGRSKLSDGERVLVVFAVAVFNGYRPRRLPLLIGDLLRLDSYNLRVVCDVLTHISEGYSAQEWADGWVSVRSSDEQADRKGLRAYDPRQLTIPGVCHGK